MHVSTAEQTVALQASVDDVWLVVEFASGTLTARRKLDELAAGRHADGVAAGRFGRNVAHLVVIITELGERGVGFVWKRWLTGPAAWPT